MACKSIQSAMPLEGVTVKVKPAGSLHAFVTFGEKETMETLLQSYSEIFDLWFDSIAPYNVKEETKNYTM